MSNYPTATGTKLSHDLENMADNANTLKRDVSALAHSAADTARSGASELREGTKRAVGTAKEKLHEAADITKEHYQEVKHKATDAAHSFQESVVAHPMLSITVAAGAGVLLGLILSRRS